MVKGLILILMSTFTVSVSADSYRKVFTNETGKVVDVSLEQNTKPDHVLQENEYPVNYSFPTNDFKYWKKVGTDWVGMTLVEQAAYDDSVKTKEADFDDWSGVTKEQMKAFILVLLDEINILRSLHSLPARTSTQLKTAIKNKL